jgi:hypothetical protein
VVDFSTVSSGLTSTFLLTTVNEPEISEKRGSGVSVGADLVLTPLAPPLDPGQRVKSFNT